MTIALRSEYVGFTVDETFRTYTLRVRKPGGVLQEFQLTIANELFLTKRVRYQDAAEICALKLDRELSKSVDGSMPDTDISVTAADLDEYREAHTKKAPPPRPRF